MNKEIEKLQEIIDDSENIVFFGGAGVSTESNIPDFRSADGLYQQKYKYSPEQIVSHTFFMRNTEGFYEFYKEKMMFLDAKPNAAHKKLAELVYEIDGRIHRNYCQKCGKFYDAAYVKNSKGVPHCECGGVIKPDVVLYEESLDENMIDKSIRAISQADTLIIGGTSLVVYPAAGFVDYFRGKHLVVINKSDTAKSVRAELTIAAPIGEVLSQITV